MVKAPITLQHGGRAARPGEAGTVTTSRSSRARTECLAPGATSNSTPAGPRRQAAPRHSAVWRRPRCARGRPCETPGAGKGLKNTLLRRGEKQKRKRGGKQQALNKHGRGRRKLEQARARSTGYGDGDTRDYRSSTRAAQPSLTSANTRRTWIEDTHMTPAAGAAF